MKICNNCQNENPSAAKHCMHCGVTFKTGDKIDNVNEIDLLNEGLNELRKNNHLLSNQLKEKPELNKNHSISNVDKSTDNNSIKKNKKYIYYFIIVICFFLAIGLFKFNPLRKEKNNRQEIINVNNKTKIQKEINSTTENVDFIEGELAVISDADGYTNLRAGKGTNFPILKKILTNEKFTIYPDSEKWWKVNTKDGLIGYIFHNRVDLLNRSFYIINVASTKTETQALKEVENLKESGYIAGHLWIPNYRSLSEKKMYSVYIGPFDSKKECESKLEEYIDVFPTAYASLVSQDVNTVEIRVPYKSKNEYINTSIYGLYPQSSQRHLNKFDLKNMSIHDLRIMRNEIFARYGHSFIKGREMYLYFNRQPWYEDKEIDATYLLTSIEKYNIKLIQSYENN